MIQDKIKKQTTHSFWQGSVHAFSPRVKVLENLWQSLCQCENLPQLDRWMAKELRKDRRLGSKDRQWYYEAMFRIIRQGVWIARSQLVYQSLEENPTAIPSYSIFIEDLSSWQPRRWWSLLRSFDLTILWPWLFLREEAATAAQNWEKVWQSNLFSNFTDEQRNTYINVIQYWLCGMQELSGDQAIAITALWHSFPPQLMPSLMHRKVLSTWTDQDLLTFIKSQNIRAPLWLRLVDTIYANDINNEFNAIGLKLFQRETFSYRIDESSEDIDKARRKIKKLKSFESGRFEIQDYASQLIGLAIPMEGVHFIWDACAGGGGKTLQIASRMRLAENKGVVFASDIRSYKLEEISQRARRSKLKNIKLLPWDGVTRPQIPTVIENNHGFDAILIDAPCSSTGTWRRNPDACYRLTDTWLRGLNEIQEKLLDVPFEVLKNKGFLIYATCSWLYEENESIIECWLKRQPELKLISMNILGLPQEDSDTMFVAVMQKQML